MGARAAICRPTIRTTACRRGHDPVWNNANCRNRRLFNDRAVQQGGGEHQAVPAADLPARHGRRQFRPDEGPLVADPRPRPPLGRVPHGLPAVVRDARTCPGRGAAFSRRCEASSGHDAPQSRTRTQGGWTGKSVNSPSGTRNAGKLFRAPQFSCEPPDRFGLDRVRHRARFGMIAFGAFKRSMFETFGPRRYAFQFHSPLTSRTSRALNWSESIVGTGTCCCSSGFPLIQQA